jgi:hypothetical protein
VAGRLPYLAVNAPERELKTYKNVNALRIDDNVCASFDYFLSFGGEIWQNTTNFS